MKTILNHHLFELAVNVLVIMALIAATKMLLNLAPDGGFVGDVKKFFMLA